MSGEFQDPAQSRYLDAPPHGGSVVSDLRGFLLKEIMISFLINIALNLCFAILLFDTSARIPLWGPAGVAIDLLPTTFMPALMMTFGITLGIRHRTRQGRVLPVPPAFPAVRLPRMLAVRALTVGLLAVIVIGPPVLGFIALSWTGPWSWAGFVAFKLAFSALHAALVTPVVVIAALQSQNSDS